MTRILVLLTALLLSSCGSTAKTTGFALPADANEKISSIAILPNAGIIADAIGIELGMRGLNVVDLSDNSNVTVSGSYDALSITNNQKLSELSRKGIDAVLVTKSVEGYDGKPQSAIARIVLTKNAKTVAGVTWQNGSSGAQGSHADNLARTDLLGAAKSMADKLSEQLHIQ